MKCYKLKSFEQILNDPDVILKDGNKFIHKKFWRTLCRTTYDMWYGRVGRVHREDMNMYNIIFDGIPSEFDLTKQFVWCYMEECDDNKNEKQRGDTK